MGFIRKHSSKLKQEQKHLSTATLGRETTVIGLVQFDNDGDMDPSSIIPRVRVDRGWIRAHGDGSHSGKHQSEPGSIFCLEADWRGAVWYIAKRGQRSID